MLKITDELPLLNMPNIKHLLKIVARQCGVFDTLRRGGIWLQARRRAVHDPEYLELPPHLNGMLLLDVGANLGQSIISLHSLFPDSRIMSFEPNPACHASLKKVASEIGSAVELYFVGIGDIKDDLTFNVPVLTDGTELLQEGSFDLGVFSETVTKQRIGTTFKLRNIQISVQRIDDFGINPSLIKIDVQGFEMQVLRGAIETIRRARPVLFLERDMRTEETLTTFMDEFDYDHRVLGCNVMLWPRS